LILAKLKKEQKAYLKQCKRCHGNGTKGSAMQSQDSWATAFENEAAVFKK
jgi:mono/diheme cytochrome c family protein